MIRLRHVGLDRDPLVRREAGEPVPRGGRAAQRRMARGTRLLADISLDIGAGEFRWLLGPSGAGKTSLLRVMALAERPTQGSVELFGSGMSASGRPPRRYAPKLRRRIGFVHQDFRLLPDLSLFDNVALPLRLDRRAEGELREDVAEMLSWLGLAHRFDARPRELSGGEQQRAAIARAVVGRPGILLADEPTGNLDDAMAERVLQLFVELHQLGSTVVVATHNTALVRAFPAPYIRLTGGRLAGPASA